MKRLFLLSVVILMAVSILAQNTEVQWGKDVNLHKYRYAYVMPTSGVTSGGLRRDLLLGIVGGPTKTVNPAEKISGYLMKMGYTILPSINPDLSDQTMIVTYGNTGSGGSNYSSASMVMIQMRDAATQELVISLETEGCGNDESDAITNAIHESMLMFQYCYDPAIIVYTSKVSKNRISVSVSNETPNIVKEINLRITYYSPEGELVHEQTVGAHGNLYPTQNANISIKRDKEARNKTFKFNIDVISYN